MWLATVFTESHELTLLFMQVSFYLPSMSEVKYKPVIYYHHAV